MPFFSSPRPEAGARAALTFIFAAGDPRWNGQTGRVYLYRVLVEPDGSDLSVEEIAVITASDGEPFDFFGASVSLSEDARWLLVGAPGKGFNAGAAYLYDLGDLVVASEPGPAEVPEGLGLAVRPNPAGDMAAVVLTLPEAGAVEAVLYDALGRRVAVIHDGILAAGEHRLPAAAGHLPAGIYVVRVRAGGAVATVRLTLVR